jgi:hypothetical protein
MKVIYKNLILFFLVCVSCAACRKSVVPEVDGTARTAVISAAAPPPPFRQRCPPRRPHRSLLPLTLLLLRPPKPAKAFATSTSKTS